MDRPCASDLNVAGGLFRMDLKTYAWQNGWVGGVCVGAGGDGGGSCLYIIAAYKDVEKILVGFLASNEVGVVF